MSHLETVKNCVIPLDLEVIRAGVERAGGELMEGQKKHQFFATKKGKCDHAIRIKDANRDLRTQTYEIGLVKSEDGTGYELRYDKFGGALEAAFGKNLGKLRDEINIETQTRVARRRGYTVRRVVVNGKAQLRATKGR